MHLHALQHDHAGWAGLEKRCQAALEQAPVFSAALCQVTLLCLHRAPQKTRVTEARRTVRVSLLLAQPGSRAHCIAAS